MEVRYRRELNDTYMILDGEPDCEEFALEILKHNRIDGLMPLSLRETDGRTEYRFRITRGNSLFSRLSRSPVTPEEIRTLLFGLSRVLDQMGEYLLDADHLVLAPEFIYTEPERNRVQFCCHPAFRKDFFEQLRDLFQYLLGKLDHSDPESVELVYEMYEISRQECFRFEDLLEAAGRGICRQPEEQGRQEVPAEPEEERKLWRAPDGEPGRDGRRGRDDGRVRDSGRERDSGRGRGFPVPLFSLFLLLAGFVFAAAGVWSLLSAAADWRFFAAAGILAAAAVIRAVLPRGGNSPEDETEMPAEEPAERPTGASTDVPAGMPTGASTGVPAGRPTGVPAGRPAGASTGVPAGRPAGVPAEAPVWGNRPPEYRGYAAAEDEGEQTQLLGFGTATLPGGRMLVSGDALQYASIRIDAFPCVIGKRGSGTDCEIDSPVISRNHARLEAESGKIFLADCRSTNGTYVNGVRLEPGVRMPLREGDEVMLANLKYVFR